MNFHKFDIPEAINCVQLKTELNCDDVYVLEDKLVIVGSLSEAQAKAGLAAHIAVAKPEPTIDEKLASVGLSINDLKAALGL